MATVRPFAYNTGSPIPDTEQVGNLAIGTRGRDYSGNYGGVRWFMGPDEDLGYVIAHQTAGNDQPTQPGIIPPFGDVGFWRTVGFLDSEFIKLSQFVARITGDPQVFATADDAKTWLNDNGYWTSFGLIPVSPTPTPSVTVTPSITTTPDTTPTPTPTSGDETLIDPIITNEDEYIEVGNDEYLMFVDPVEPSPTPTPTTTSTPTRTPTRTPTPTLTPTNTPYPPNSYKFYLTEGSNPVIPQSNGDIMFIETGDLVTYNPNDSFEIVFTAIDKSGTSHPEYDDLLIYGGTITLTQDSNTYIASGISGFFSYTSTIVSYYSANYLDVIQLSPNPFVSGSPIYLTASVNYPPTPTNTPTITQTPTSSEVPVSPTQTVTPTNTPTPSVTLTMTPTSSEVPVTPTPTPTPTSSVTPSGFTVTISEVGSDVVMSASGTLNINDLTFVTGTTFAGSGIGINTATFIMGSGGDGETYSGFTTTPSNFGTGSGSGSSSSSGDIFGVIFNSAPPHLLAVPSGYTTGDFISSTQTFNSQSFSSLGLVPGTYTYSWGSGANADSINVVVGGPAPTPTPTPTQGVSGDFNVTISQVGPDVVWNGSGSFNLDALTSAGSNTMAAGFQASQAIWAIGPNAPVDTYSGTITYPTTFGSGGVGVTSTSGSTFGILPGGTGRLLYVPSGYISNTTISGSATYASQTIAGMGLTSGTYTWSWGSGGNTSTLIMTIG